MIQVFHSVEAARTALGSCLLTIGKYDGMHLGHQRILQQLKSEAAQRNLPTLVILSEPQPEELFAGDAAPARLTAFHDKVAFLDGFGIDAVYCMRFDRATSSQLPEQFVRRTLLEGLGMQGIVVGEDFRFGQHRKGSIATLQQLAADSGFSVTTVAPCLDGTERISSTLIRHYLEHGDCQRAYCCLGRPYAISGKVIEGKKLGRQLGFPTANVELHSNKLALSGVFVVEAQHGKVLRPGVASIGFNPTVSDIRQASLEVFLLDYDGDLYGSELTVNFLHKLRDELKYPSLAELQQQMALDVQQTRDFFGARR
jgi:riboflavin kinase/FMN adenylyltransferase